MGVSRYLVSLSSFYTFLYKPLTTQLFSWNHGQACCAGSRIFVHTKIYDEFLRRFTEKTKSLKLGDPFEKDSYQGPQVSQIQFDVCVNFFVCFLLTN